MVVHFSDLDKRSRDILIDGYELKRVLKVKHTTPQGITVTTKNEHQKGVSGVVEAKYYHPESGVMIDKLSLKKDGSLALEASKATMLKQAHSVLNTSVKVDDSLKGTLTTEVLHPKASTKLTADSERSYIRGSTSVSAGQYALIGGEAVATADSKASVEDYSVGGSVTAFRWGASLTCTNKLQTYNASAFAMLKPNLIASALGSCTPDKNESSCTAGVMYTMNPKTTLRAKVDMKGTVTACAEQICAPKTKISLTGQVVKGSSPQLGVMLSLG